jgi:hypothetical protein
MHLNSHFGSVLIHEVLRLANDDAEKSQSLVKLRVFLSQAWLSLLPALPASWLPLPVYFFF